MKKIVIKVLMLTVLLSVSVSSYAYDFEVDGIYYNKIDGGHEIQREHIKLNADPKHERHAEQSAEENAALFFRKQKSCRGQVGYSVDDKQRNSGKGEALKKHL